VGYARSINATIAAVNAWSGDGHWFLARVSSSANNGVNERKAKRCKTSAVCGLANRTDEPAKQRREKVAVIYKFKTLGELAAYFEAKAVDLRATITLNAKKREAETLKRQASIYEEVGHVLRNTIIEP
jgi:hypothetical protein